METLLDTSTLSVQEITGRLAASEDDGEPTSASDGGKLYLTEEQWLEHYKQKEPEGSHAGGGSGTRGKGRGPKNKARDGSGRTTARKGDKCRYCGKLGHWAKECRSKKRDKQAQAQAHVA
jgi:hypothetical protein